MTCLGDAKKNQISSQLRFNTYGNEKISKQNYSLVKSNEKIEENKYDIEKRNAEKV